MFKRLLNKLRGLFGWLLSRRQRRATFCGEYPLQIESVTINAKSRKLSSWTVEINGEWPIYLCPSPEVVGGQVAPGLTYEQLYDDRHWPRFPDGSPRFHVPIGDVTPIAGTKVIWKDSPLDYLWGEGVLTQCSLHGWYVEGPGSFTHIGWSVKRGCWITQGASSKSALEALDWS